MDRSDLTAVLCEITAMLENLEIRYALVGGLAFSLLVHPRATIDLDVLVSVAETEIELLKRALEVRFPGIIIHDRVMHLGHTTLLRAVFSRPEMEELIFDFLLCTDWFDKQAIDNALKTDFGGFPLSVVRPEDLIVLKLLAGRDQDLIDIRALIRAFPDQLDREYLESTLHRLDRSISEIA